MKGLLVNLDQNTRTLLQLCESGNIEQKAVLISFQGVGRSSLLCEQECICPIHSSRLAVSIISGEHYCIKPTCTYKPKFLPKRRHQLTPYISKNKRTGLWTIQFNNNRTAYETPNFQDAITFGGFIAVLSSREIIAVAGAVLTAVCIAEGLI